MQILQNFREGIHKGQKSITKNRGLCLDLDRGIAGEKRQEHAKKGSISVLEGFKYS